MGVRSFDNTHAETIGFLTPLTLIVGYNGSGKTTIIECLKYATTGDLPPNSKGGAFIHDPKLCGEKEVLAQVKLSFKATTGAKMVVTRSLQLTAKKATRQQKTLDCHLLMVRNGERTAISSRVAELDQMMPRYLGVSKAVLDSVIFCHQDDSLWPMSEPSVLKKKFDEIFEALKYTKAIDNIKILRKKQNEELGKLKIEESQYKIDKDRGERAEKKSQQLSKELDLLREEIEDLTTQLREAQAESNDLFEHAKNFEGVIAELNAVQIQTKHTEETVEKLRKRIDEIAESDDWLRSTLEQYDERVKEMRRKIEEASKSYTDLGNQIKRNRQTLGDKMTEEGKLEAEKDGFDRQIKHRETLIKETAALHNFRGFSQNLNDKLIQDFISRLAKEVREQAAALEKAKQETREELRAAQKVISEIETRISSLQSTKETAKGEISSLDARSSSFQAQVDKMDIDEGSKAVLETAVREVNSRFENAKESFENASWAEQISGMETERRKEEDNLKRLHAEQIDVTNRARDLANLEYLQKTLKETKQKQDTMEGAHSERISAIIGSNWEIESLETAFNSFSDRHKSDLFEAEQRRNGTSREFEQMEYQISSAKQSLKSKRAELSKNEKAVRDATGEDPEDYLEVLAEAERNRDIRKFDADGYKHLHNYFQKGISWAEKKHECRLCRRGFDKASELEDFLKLLQAQASKGNDAIAEELREFEENVVTIRAVRPSFELYKRLKDLDIPTLEADAKKHEEQLSELRPRLEQQDTAVSDLFSTKKDLESISKTVQTIIKLSQDAKTFESQIAEQTSQTRHGGSTRTLDDLQRLTAESMEKLQSLTSKTSKLTNDKSRAASNLSALDIELREAKEKLVAANYQLKEKLGLLERLNEIRSSTKTQREIIKSSDDQIQQIMPQIRQAETKRDDIQHRGAEAERALQEESTRLNDSLYKIRLTEREIQAYLEKGGPARLSSCKQEVQGIRLEISKQESNQQVINREISQMQELTNRTDETKRQIQDNIDYRDQKRSLASLHERISTLRAKNAEHDRAVYQAQAAQVDRRIQTLNTSRSSKSGAAKSKDDELQRLLQEYETDYKDSASKYKEAHIRVETTKAAIEDLARYGSALDKAIMKYHALKMEEINRIIDELWRRTYQGTDVDTVMIRSENDNASGTASASTSTARTGNRTYNYRVVMLKQEVEMDMRGRCSAGQKVLASIIIRLALAECFSTNCGVLALDEPTTNLDADNIRALAAALHDIIEARRGQANFQLIVITHDEEFLRYMKCSEFCEKYFRVVRDERQKSTIGKLSIQEVM